ncbi:MAG: formate--phosphoribosylaminoimidazolecarboxamide ligase family protein [Thermoplasmata archaeon]|nr:formate--phosphoribosylaminoimidazolecarboxamide ligase family protein [Thermoplasmata archaeon]
MLSRPEVQEIVSGYDKDRIKIGMIASHSALDACDGAIEEGFPTLAICQRGREEVYTKYFRSRRDADGAVTRGIVDETWVFEKFKDIMAQENQERLRNENVLFVPNRSFTSYVDLGEIEDNFRVPLLGSRNMLRSEEREEKHSYYWLLEKAGLPFPERIEHPEDIDELVVVKLHHAQKKLERGFFTASSFKEYQEKSQRLLSQGVIDQESLDQARMERYIIGPVFNLDFFYSPIEEEMSKLELIGIDWRFESSLDGHVRLPAPQQMTLSEKQFLPEYTVVGHNSCTLRESLLERAFRLGERYVEASQEYNHPGIIGPFCLQTCVDKDMNFYIYDVAPRIGGGTNVHMSVGHAYGNALWRTPMSTGRRLALEVKRAIETDRLEIIVT